MTHSAMTPDEWRKIRDVVESALELEGHDRDRFLDGTCDDDPLLRAEVESLLRAYAAGDTLDRPLFDLKVAMENAGTPATARARRLEAGASALRLALKNREIAAGDVLGPYRILDELGHGGMGTVYLALPEDAADDLVAVKVAQRGLPRHAWRRFQIEYRILQGLDHPGIARVLDAGATDDGRPFFVMEYIEGTQIDAYCEEHGLSAAARLALVLKVCDAVEAAHRQGVVHRDLKPSNILVTAGDEPKLLDFGIAKLLEPEAQSFTVDSTRTNEHPLTPQYASPEQILGEAITPSADVYSLGVVTYKLMTGRLPYVLERYTLGAVERAFEERSPPRPSAVAAASGFGTLGGDLDAAVMKALSVKVESRFSTVSELTEELRRSLESQPSSARIVMSRFRGLQLAASRKLARGRGAVYSWAVLVVIVLLILLVWGD